MGAIANRGMEMLKYHEESSSHRRCQYMHAYNAGQRGMRKARRWMLDVGCAGLFGRKKVGRLLVVEKVQTSFRDLGAGTRQLYFKPGRITMGAARGDH